MTVSKSFGNPLLEDSGRAGEIEISGTKMPMPLPKSLLSSLKGDAGGGHIVYVRRKPEAELVKSHVCETLSDAVDCAYLRKSTERCEGPQGHAEMNKPLIYVPDISPPQKASSPSFSSARDSVSPSLGMPGNMSSPVNVNLVHIDCVNPSSDDPIAANIKLWKERYLQLRSLLKLLDQSEQDEYVQRLRSLSSVELSQHAAELEKRSIKLSLEEAREMDRVGLFDVLGNYKTKNVGTQQLQQIHK